MKTEKFRRLNDAILATADIDAQKIILPRLQAVSEEIAQKLKTAYKEGQMSQMSTGEKAEYLAFFPLPASTSPRICAFCSCIAMDDSELCPACKRDFDEA